MPLDANRIVEELRVIAGLLGSPEGADQAGRLVGDLERRIATRGLADADPAGLDRAEEARRRAEVERDRAEEYRARLAQARETIDRLTVGTDPVGRLLTALPPGSSLTIAIPRE